MNPGHRQPESMRLKHDISALLTRVNYATDYRVPPVQALAKSFNRSRIMLCKFVFNEKSLRFNW